MQILNKIKNKVIRFMINSNIIKKPYPSSLFDQIVKNWETTSVLRKVNLGCGARFEKDWINIDFYSCPPDVFMYNLTKPLPFKSGFLDVVYSSNCLEHFSKSDAECFLKECIRILKPEGILRLAVPDLEMICRSYLNALEHAKNNDSGWNEKYEWSLIELLDQCTRQSYGGEMLRYWCKDVVPGEEFVIERVGTEYLNFRDYYNKTYPGP